MKNRNLIVRLALPLVIMLGIVFVFAGCTAKTQDAQTAVLLAQNEGGMIDPCPGDSCPGVCCGGNTGGNTGGGGGGGGITCGQDQHIEGTACVQNTNTGGNTGGGGITCGQDQHIEGTACVQNTNTGGNTGSGTTCPTGQYWNTATNSCSTTATTAPSTGDAGVCTANRGVWCGTYCKMTSGPCDSVNTNSTGMQPCPNGTSVPMGQTCSTTTTCPGEQYWNAATSSCTPTGNIMTQATCTRDGGTWVNGGCNWPVTTGTMMQGTMMNQQGMQNTTTTQQPWMQQQQTWMQWDNQTTQPFVAPMMGPNMGSQNGAQQNQWFDQSGQFKSEDFNKAYQQAGPFKNYDYAQDAQKFSIDYSQAEDMQFNVQNAQFEVKRLQSDGKRAVKDIEKAQKELDRFLKRTGNLTTCPAIATATTAVASVKAAAEVMANATTDTVEQAMLAQEELYTNGLMNEMWQAVGQSNMCEGIAFFVKDMTRQIDKMTKEASRVKTVETKATLDGILKKLKALVADPYSKADFEKCQNMGPSMGQGMSPSGQGGYGFNSVISSSSAGSTKTNNQMSGNQMSGSQMGGMGGQMGQGMNGQMGGMGGQMGQGMNSQMGQGMNSQMGQGMGMGSTMGGGQMGGQMMGPSCDPMEDLRFSFMGLADDFRFIMQDQFQSMQQQNVCGTFEMIRENISIEADSGNMPADVLEKVSSLLNKGTQACDAGDMITASKVLGMLDSMKREFEKGGFEGKNSGFEGLDAKSFLTDEFTSEFGGIKGIDIDALIAKIEERLLSKMQQQVETMANAMAQKLFAQFAQLQSSLAESLSTSLAKMTDNVTIGFKNNPELQNKVLENQTTTTEAVAEVDKVVATVIDDLPESVQLDYQQILKDATGFNSSDTTSAIQKELDTLSTAVATAETKAEAIAIFEEEIPATREYIENIVKNDVDAKLDEGIVPFQDVVDPTEWYFGYSTAAKQAGYVNGQIVDGEPVMNAASPTNMAEGLTMVARMAAGGSENIPNDVDLSNSVVRGMPTWAQPAATYLKNKGIDLTEIVGNKKASAPMLRKEMIQLVGQSLGTEGSPSTLSNFPDATGMSSAQTSAAAGLVEAGIVSGTGDGRLNPNGQLNRAEFAKIIVGASEQLQ